MILAVKPSSFFERLVSPPLDLLDPAQQVLHRVVHAQHRQRELLLPPLLGALRRGQAGARGSCAELLDALDAFAPTGLELLVSALELAEPTVVQVLEKPKQRFRAQTRPRLRGFFRKQLFVQVGPDSFFGRQTATGQSHFANESGARPSRPEKFPDMLYMSIKFEPYIVICIAIRLGLKI